MTRVEVRVRPAHLLPPPIIKVTPSNQTVPVGGRVALICRVWRADSIKWIFQDSMMKLTSRHKVLQDNTLTISGKNKSNSNHYNLSRWSNILSYLIYA